MASPQLGALQQEFEDASAAAGRLVDGLASSQLLWSDSADHWSIAQCLVHLTLSSQVYTPLIDAAIADAHLRRLYDPGPYKMDLAGRMIKWGLEPPARFKMKTTAQFQPVVVENVEQVLPDFLQSQQELLDRLNRSDGLAMNRLKIPSPFNARIHYNLFSCLNVLAAHERRHLCQAERVRLLLTSVTTR